MHKLKELFDQCWTETGNAEDDDRPSITAATEAQADMSRGRLVYRKLATLRQLIAEFCFRDDPNISLTELGYLRRILEIQPVGSVEVAFGMLDLARFFME